MNPPARPHSHTSPPGWWGGNAGRETGLLAICLAAVAWSTGGLFIKWLPFNAPTILCYRALCGATLFAALYRGKVFQFHPTTALVAGCYALLAICFVVATKMTTAANAVFLQYTAPIYVLLLEPILFRSPLSRLNGITVLVCMLGMVLFFWDDLGGGSLTGNLVALAAGVFLAGMMLAQRFNPPQRHEAGIFQGNLLIVVLTLPWLVAAPLPVGQQWAMLLFLGFVQIGLGYLLFTYGLKKVTAVEAVLIAMLEPILNPLWVYWGYGEKPGGFAILGGGVILGMLVVQTLLRARQSH